MTNQIFSLDRRRASFYIFIEALMAFFSGSGQVFDAESALIMPMVVRIHAKLDATKSKYTLDLGAGNQASLSIEKKLNKSDIFLMTGIKVAVQKYDPSSPDFDSPSFTFPDPVYFGATVAKKIAKIFQGRLSLKTGTQTRIDGLDLDLAMFVPKDGFAGTLAAPTDYPQHGATDAEKGYYDLGSYPVIFGENQNTIDIELAQGDITGIVDGATAANSNNLVFYALGWVYRGSVGNPAACKTA